MKTEFEQSTVNYFSEETISAPPQRWQKQMRPELSDVILINPHKTTDWIGEFQRHYPHIPIVTMKADDDTTLKTAFQKIEKMRQLPSQTIEMLGHDTWLALLAYLWLEETQSFYLMLDGQHATGYRYTLDSTYQELPLLLSSMEQIGLLTKTLANRAYQCHQCHSIKLLIREGCLACHSDLVIEQPLIHHFDCAYQAVEQQFIRTGANTLQCPKCREELKHLGVDHDKPGAGYYCQSCELTHSDTAIQADCLNCQARFIPTESHLINLYHYHLSSQGIQYLFNKRENSSNLIHSNSEFNQFYESYLNLAKSSKLQSAIITLTLTVTPTPAEKIHLLLSIAEQLKQQLAPEQIITFHWDTLYLLLPGSSTQEANVFNQTQLAAFDTIRTNVMDILEFSRFS